MPVQSFLTKCKKFKILLNLCTRYFQIAVICNSLFESPTPIHILYAFMVSKYRNKKIMVVVINSTVQSFYCNNKRGWLFILLICKQMEGLSENKNKLLCKSNPKNSQFGFIWNYAYISMYYVFMYFADQNFLLKCS